MTHLAPQHSKIDPTLSSPLYSLEENCSTVKPALTRTLKEAQTHHKQAQIYFYIFTNFHWDEEGRNAEVQYSAL